MFKRILKIIGITLAIFVVVAGLGFGIYAIGGGFKNEDIVIQALYFDSETETTRVDYSLDDVTITINCTPKNATDKKLELSIIDDVGVLDNPPTSVIAGQAFKLKIKKDADGNNIGGVVNITATKGTGFVKYTLISDVAIPNNVVYFASGENATSHPIDGITMAISPETERHIYLNSSLVNAFYLDAGKDGKVDNLKEIEIGYKYYSRSTGEEITELSKVFAKDELVPTKSAITDKYYFEIPILPKVSGTIEVYAKMHRTKEIQDAFSQFKIFETATSQTSEVSNLFDEYSDFFNTYLKYFDIDDNDYEELIQSVTMQSDGRVYFNNLASVKKSLDYVYVNASITIEVVDADIESITSQLDVTPSVDYDVNESVTYDLKQLIDEYSLNAYIKSTQTTFTSSDYSYFMDLVVTPVLYLTKGEATGGDGTNADNKYDASVWGEFDTYGVYSEDYEVSGKQQEFETSNGKQRFKLISSTTVTPDENDGYAGYLIKLNKTLTGRHNYFTTTKDDSYVNGIPSWTFEFNVPKTSVIGDCLYVMFEMTSTNPSTGVETYSYTFTPISITYDEASQSEVMEFDDFNSKMTITSSLNNENYLTTQYLSIKGNSTTSATYKNIMYFVEKTSNNPEDGGVGVAEATENTNIANKKVVAIGTYQFIWLDDTLQMNGETNLYGERIPTYDSVKKQFYIEPINVTNDEDVKVFAVRYLTDRDGNPIDKYGRIIDFTNETTSSTETPIELVILDITQTMGSCSIDAFAEKINFYTFDESKHPGWTVSKDSGEQIQLAFTGKRNNFDSNYSEDAENFLSITNEINADLSLKLLYNMEFVVYVSNMDLIANGTSFDQNAEPTELKATNLVYPNGDKYSVDLIFERDTALNEKNAFYKLINKSGNVYDYNLDFASSDFDVTRDTIDTTTEIPPYITYRITPKASSIDTSASFAIKESDGVSATTNLNASYNKVSYVVNQLEISGTSLNLANNKYNYNNNVYVEYVSSTSSASALESSESSVHTSPNGELMFSDTKGGSSSYTLMEKDNLINNGIVDINNLLDGEEINRSLVDWSVALGDDTSGLTKYVNDNTNTRITEVYVPETVYKLSQDLQFVATLAEDGKYTIKIADDEITESSSFTLCGMNLTVESDGQDGYYVKIPAGTLLPSVEKNGKSYVYLLDYLFEIKDPAGNPYIMSENNNGTSAGISADFSYTNTLGNSIKYSNRNYFSSYDNPINSDGTINFTYGEEFTDGGIYTGAPAFIIVKTKYSYTTGETEEFYNAIQFELHQEDIELFARDSTGDDLDYIYDDSNFVKDNNNTINYFKFNSNTNRATITAARVSNKATSSKLTINVLTDNTTNVFAKYIEFELTDTSAEGFGFAGTASGTITSASTMNVNESWELYIVAPQSIYDEFATLQIKYKNKYHMSNSNEPEYIYKYIRLQVDSTLTFGINTDTNKVSIVNGDYKLTLDSTITSISGSDWSEYFDIPSGYTLKLVKDSGSTCTLDASGTLTTKTIYSSSSSNQIEESRYTLKLQGANTITITTKLSVIVEPTYIVEVATGIENITFKVGDSIFGNVIIIKNANENVIDYDPADSNSSYNALTISLVGNGESIISDNVINYTGIDDITNATLTITLKTTDDYSNCYTPSNGGVDATYSNIKIGGIEIKYDANGDITTNSSTAETIDTSATRTIQLTVNLDGTIDISNYFSVNIEEHFVAIKVDGESVKYFNSEIVMGTDVAEGSSYSIAIIDIDDNVIVTFDNINLTFIVPTVTIKFDSDGDNSYIAPSELDLETTKTITLTAVDGKVDLTEYFTSVTSTSNESIAVGIKVGESTTGVGGVISISSDIAYGTSYTLCVYYTGSDKIVREFSAITIIFAEPTA